MAYVESNGHVTQKGRDRDPNMFDAVISKTAGDRGLVAKDTSR